MEIVGYNNYLIYPDGKVYSKKRKKYLSLGKDKNGYELVTLCKNNTCKSFRFHRILAQHYIPNPENKTQIDHINRDTSDNRVENLRWVSHSENNINRKCCNKTGHKHITKVYHKDKINYSYRVNPIKRNKTKIGTNKTFKTLTDALCYKYIQLLKIKSNIYHTI